MKKTVRPISALVCVMLSTLTSISVSSHMTLSDFIKRSKNLGESPRLKRQMIDNRIPQLASSHNSHWLSSRESSPKFGMFQHRASGYPASRFSNPFPIQQLPPRLPLQQLPPRLPAQYPPVAKISQPKWLDNFEADRLQHQKMNSFNPAFALNRPELTNNKIPLPSENVLKPSEDVNEQDMSRIEQPWSFTEQLKHDAPFRDEETDRAIEEDPLSFGALGDIASLLDEDLGTSSPDHLGHFKEPNPFIVDPSVSIGKDIMEQFLTFMELKASGQLDKCMKASNQAGEAKTDKE